MPAAPGELVFAETMGVCGGVRAAIEFAERVKEAGAHAGVAIWGLHDIVHNERVVDSLTAPDELGDPGITFTNDIDEIPSGSAVIISAHGAGPEVFDGIRRRGSEPLDATCWLVKLTHQEIDEARENGEKVIYVCHGKPGDVANLHDEVAGTLGHLDYRIDHEGASFDPIDRSYLEQDEELTTALLSEAEHYRIVTQTTLIARDVLAYRERITQFIKAHQPEAQIAGLERGNVCRAVDERQSAVIKLIAAHADLDQILVITDRHSKNGMGYAQLAAQLTQGTPTTVEVVESAAEARQVVKNGGKVGVTASASSPDPLIVEVIEELGSTAKPPLEKKLFRLADLKILDPVMERLRLRKKSR